jgi:NADPH:quinone reductase-like Zn-dependent oxidoreductase
MLRRPAEAVGAVTLRLLGAPGLGSASPPKGQTVEAVVQDRYGDVEVLAVRDVDAPVPGDGEVLIRVRAAGVDPGTWHLMTGRPYFVRLMGFGLRAPKVRIRGRDVAGTVESVGTHVTGLKPGDEVYGTVEGSFAEFACAAATRFAPKPGKLTLEQAAAVPISGMTALVAVRAGGGVQRGQRVLVIGAGGGVGSFAVQVAKASGAHVTGVCGPTKAELVSCIGADEVIDYTREDFTDGGRQFDRIIDTAGRRPLSALRRALVEDGVLVLVGGEGGGPWLGGFQRQITAPLRGLGGKQKLIGLAYRETPELLEALSELIEAGKVTPVIDRVYPLGQAAEAIRYLAQGHVAGKVVLAVP